MFHFTDNKEIVYLDNGAGLIKNADGTYEYVPAAGASGGAGAYAGSYEYSVGGTGQAGSTKGKRATGGGGSGSSHYESTGGAGGTGTSYSGGTGGGAKNRSGTGAAGNNYGGAGGVGVDSSSYVGIGYRSGSGGSGNPGGTGAGTTGANGTGGLLVIYANEYANSGKVTANGTTTNSDAIGGGSSGGGSINIFTNQSTGINQLGVITNTKYNQILGTVNYAGGAATGNNTKGGAGGAGTINIGEIRNGTYYDLKAIIEQDKAAYEATVIKTGDSI